jgi:two-component sensor histidine kinase
LVIAVAVSIVPAVTIVSVTGAVYARHMEEKAIEDVRRQAIAFGDIQLRITESARHILATVAAMPMPCGDEPNGRAAVGEFETLLKAIHAENTDYLNITITDGRGIVVASSLLAAGTDLSGRPHVRKAIETGRFSAGEYVVGIVQSAPSFAFSLPAFDAGGELRGTINVLYKLSSYEALYENFDLPEGAFLGLVDRKGLRLFYYPESASNPLGKPIKGDIWRKFTDGPDNGTFSGVSSDGVERIYGYTKLRVAGDGEPYMTVAYAIPREGALAAVHSVSAATLLAMAIAGSVALALALVSSQLLFGRRLARIVRAVDRIRAGDLAARVAFARDASDLGRIGAALDGMAAEVQRRDGEKAEEARRLGELLEEKRVLIREVHHRVKNNLQVVMSLIRLEEGAPVDKAEALKDLDARVTAMAMVHEMLYEAEDIAVIDLRSYCRRLFESLRESLAPGSPIAARFDCEEIPCGLDRAVPVGLLFAELASNAIKHSGAGEVRVSLIRQGRMVRLVVASDGPLPESFELRDSAGLGLQIATALARQLDGILSVEPGADARFAFEFSVEA